MKKLLRMVLVVVLILVLQAFGTFLWTFNGRRSASGGSTRITWPS